MLKKYDCDYVHLNSFSHRPQITTLAAFGIAMAASAVSGAINKWITDSTNKQNRDWHEEDQSRLEGREDNALSRRVSDAQNAGLSPLAALQIGPAQASMTQQAPAQSWQADLSALSDLAMADSQTDKQTESNEWIAKGHDAAQIEVALKNSDTQKAIAEKNIAANKEIAANALGEQAREFDQSFIQKDNELNLRYIEGCRRDELTLKAMNNDIQRTNFSQWQEIQRANLESVKQWSQDMGLDLKVIEIDVSTKEGQERYRRCLAQEMDSKAARMERYQDYRKQHADDPAAIASLYSHGKDISGGVSGSLGQSKVGASVNGNYQINETISKSEQAERLQMYQLWEKGDRTFYHYVPKGRMSYQSGNDLPKWNKK